MAYRRCFYLHTLIQVMTIISIHVLLFNELEEDIRSTYLGEIDETIACDFSDFVKRDSRRWRNREQMD